MSLLKKINTVLGSNKKKSTKKVDELLKFRFGLKYRLNLYERLSAFTKEEFPLFDSLQKFRNRYNKKKDFRGKIIDYWLEDMKYGASFSNVLQGWVPDAELNLIQAGEEGKGIDKGLDEAIKFAKSAQKIKKTIINGATYPIILLLVVLGFIAMFSIKMAPTYLGILPLEKWPSMGQNLYNFSHFIVSYWYIVFAIIGIIAFIISKTIGIWTGKVRELFDKVPPWSVYKVYQASAFLISLASMMQSGTPLNESLKKIKKTSAPWLAEYINNMEKNLKKGGKNFGSHLDVGLLDEETAGDVIDYSELGKFEEAVYTIGEKNLEQSVEKIDIRMAMIKNLMLVLVGLTVGVIYYTSIELNGTVAEAASSSTNSMIKSGNSQQ
jgi:type II secretory pathway component PulF